MNDQKNTQSLGKTQTSELEERIAANEMKIAQLEQRSKKPASNSATQKSFALMTYEEQKADLIKRALPGKCPVRFIEGDGENVDFDSALVRQPYESCEDAIKDLTGTTDYSLAAQIFVDGVSAMPGRNQGRKANIAVQALADASSQDATEARLTLQANALYSQGMTYLGRAEQQDMMTPCEFYMKNAMKLLRLHNETVEALCKYRRRGEQHITVQHVSVANQAIVNNGNMMTGGGGK